MGERTCALPELCRRDLSTSAGAHTVVATVPAAREARMWVGVLSVRDRCGEERRWDFVAVYLFEEGC